MKMTLKKGFAIGGLAVATVALLAVTDYIDKHRVIEINRTAFIQMNSDFDNLETDLLAQQEAQSVVAAIDSIDKISLTSYSEIQEVRDLYNSASDSAKEYIDEEQLLAVEEAYAQLETQRQVLLSTAEASGDLSGILDYASCNIQTSGDTYLDALIQELIRNAVSSDMSRAEQVAACYDYMVANYYYDSNYNYSYASSKRSVAWATAFLRDGYGTCNEWSAAFVYVMRALGYDADLYYGGTATSGSGSIEHYWPVVHIDGIDYVFDPQVEGDMTRKSGVNSHSRFGLSGNSANEKYYFSQIVD